MRFIKKSDMYVVSRKWGRGGIRGKVQIAKF